MEMTWNGIYKIRLLMIYRGMTEKFHVGTTRWLPWPINRCISSYLKDVNDHQANMWSHDVPSAFVNSLNLLIPHYTGASISHFKCGRKGTEILDDTSLNEINILQAEAMVSETSRFIVAVLSRKRIFIYYLFLATYYFRSYGHAI